MNTALWVVQGLLAFVFTASGLFKVVRSRQQIIAMGQKWAEDFSDGQVKLLGVAEVLGGIGLVVPWATGIARVLTPAAALCLAILMAGAVMTRRRRKEPAAGDVVLVILALFVIVLRGAQLGTP